MNRDGYVYILTNESMPGLVKIGKTRRGGRHRATELFQTGVPSPFRLEFEIYTHDCDSLEFSAHNQLSDKRVSSNREFFKVDNIEDAIAAVLDAYLSDYDILTIIAEFADIQSDLYKIACNAGLDEHPVNTRDLLRFIDPDAIKKASALRDDFYKEGMTRAKEKYFRG